MLKLAGFDLDGTLAPFGKGMEEADRRLLLELERRGVRIAVCSGKPTYYLCGFLRQIGLEQPVLIGENGAVIQLGVELPPVHYEVLPYSELAKQSIRYLKEKIEEKVPGMWYQPNEVGLTPFPKNEVQAEAVWACIREAEERIGDVDIYRHCDSFDIVPKGLSKFEGMRRCAELLGIERKETAAIGDGVNDYPMFEYAAVSVGIGLSDDCLTMRCGSIHEALCYLISLT